MEQDTFGLGIAQPVSVWNRPLKIEPKGFFLKLAKAAVNGYKLELEDAGWNLAEALTGIKAEDKAGQTA